MRSSPGFFMRRNQAHQLRRMTRTCREGGKEDERKREKREGGKGDEMNRDKREGGMVTGENRRKRRIGQRVRDTRGEDTH